MSNKPKYPITGISINPQLKADVKNLAAQLKMPFNKAVAEALEMWLNAMDKDNDKLHDELLELDSPYTDENFSYADIENSLYGVGDLDPDDMDNWLYPTEDSEGR